MNISLKIKISQFKEQLEAIGDTLDEDELIMTTLNGLTRPWDVFIQTICAKKEELHFDSMWEECIQEEARVANREALLSRDEDQALVAHTKGGRKRSYFQKEQLDLHFAWYVNFENLLF
jgi:hypothetical protein